MNIFKDIIYPIGFWFLLLLLFGYLKIYKEYRQKLKLLYTRYLLLSLYFIYEEQKRPGFPKDTIQALTRIDFEKLSFLRKRFEDCFYLSYKNFWYGICPFVVNNLYKQDQCIANKENLINIKKEKYIKKAIDNKLCKKDVLKIFKTQEYNRLEDAEYLLLWELLEGQAEFQEQFEDYTSNNHVENAFEQTKISKAWRLNITGNFANINIGCSIT